jgi:pyridoxamine 5'-phosphate oxidase
MPLDMQVRFQGTVEPVTPEEADAYFASRPRQSQLGAWASKQSQALESRLDLEKRLALTTAKYGVGDVPRPPFWSGFRLVPHHIEFWLKQPFRLHDRLSYRRDPMDANAPWETASLFP